jgi:hypothetical protein
MGRRSYYNDDPNLVDVPLSVDEAAALLAEPRAVGKSDIPHLMRRVLATAQRCETVRRNYDDELRRRTAAMPRPGLPATLSPEEAVKFLSQEQITRLFDRFSQEKLAALDTLRERAAADRAATRAIARRLLDAVTLQLAGDPAQQERLRLEELLRELRSLLEQDAG